VTGKETDPAGAVDGLPPSVAAPAATGTSGKTAVRVRAPRKLRPPAARKAAPGKAAAANGDALEAPGIKRYPTIGAALDAQYERYLAAEYPLGPPPAIPGAPPAWLTEADKATSKDPWLATVEEEIAKLKAGFDDGIETAWQDIAEIHRRYQPALVPAPAEPAFDEALAWGPGSA